MRPRLTSFVAALVGVLSLAPVYAQQVVQRGPLGRPALVMDETEQWTAPLLLASDPVVQIYMPDVSSPGWLKRNYDDFKYRGVYTLSFFTFYKTPEACRANQIAWGLGDAAHLNACIAISYRVRRVKVDPVQKSVTLLTAAMVDQSGSIDPSTVEDSNTFRTWDQLDGNTQKSLQKAHEFVSSQMKIYDEKLQSVR
jgi:hypothetical protein